MKLDPSTREKLNTVFEMAFSYWAKIGPVKYEGLSIEPNPVEDYPLTIEELRAYNEKARIYDDMVIKLQGEAEKEMDPFIAELPQEVQKPVTVIVQSIYAGYYNYSNDALAEAHQVLENELAKKEALEAGLDWSIHIQEPLEEMDGPQMEIDDEA